MSSFEVIGATFGVIGATLSHIRATSHFIGATNQLSPNSTFNRLNQKSLQERHVLGITQL
jgi:hypothetical protein